jgi:hypothetical protein
MVNGPATRSWFIGNRVCMKPGMVQTSVLGVSDGPERVNRLWVLIVCGGREGEDDDEFRADRRAPCLHGSK